MQISESKLTFARAMLRDTPRNRASVRKVCRAAHRAREDCEAWRKHGKVASVQSVQSALYVYHSLRAQCAVLLMDGSRHKE